MASNNEGNQVRDIFRTRFLSLFPAMTPGAMDQLITFKAEVIAAHTAAAILSNHEHNHIDTYYIGEAVKAAELIFSKSLPPGRFYDFGSGVGFPGLIFAILQPEREFVLLERTARKVNLMKHIISVAQIKNTTVNAGSVEDLSEKSITLGVSRSFSMITKGMLATRKAMTVGGIVYYLKGDSWSQELAAVPSQLFTHWDAALIDTARIPGTETDVSVISTKKLSE